VPTTRLEGFMFENSLYVYEGDIVKNSLAIQKDLFVLNLGKNNEEEFNENK